MQLWERLEGGSTNWLLRWRQNVPWIGAPGGRTKLKWASTNWLSMQSATVFAACCSLCTVLVKSVLMLWRTHLCKYVCISKVWNDFMSRTMFRLATERLFGAVFQCLHLQWSLPLVTKEKCIILTFLTFYSFDLRNVGKLLGFGYGLNILCFTYGKWRPSLEL